MSNSTYEKSIGYFSDLIHQKISPSIYSYSALIKSMCDSDKVEEANETVEVMKSNNLHPNEIIYTTSDFIFVLN
jgi:pentatricopeptide repeat protein